MSSNSYFDLRGQTAVITGGSGVLGRVMARALAEAGAKIVILARRLEACEQVGNEIRAQGGTARGLACDVLDRDALERAGAHVAAEFGPVDILVNAAGGNQPRATTSPAQSFFDLAPGAIREVFDVNFTGLLLACQAFGRGMAERGQGCIINVSSMSALRPLTRVAAYSAAKAAVSNFTQWLAVHMMQTYSPRIRVNAIAPGFFLTHQNRALLVDPETGAWTPRGQSIINHTPMGRLGEPEDLVSTLLWLASPASAFVTGVVVPVDGGFSAYSGV
jgi:NAD(P)-dependent dehydrogenase (short-subunit alcohol dehydrogenase family)